MISATHAILIIAVTAGCTFLTRLAPFALFGRKEPPKAVLYIGEVLPAAVIAILVIYCLRGTSFMEMSKWLPAFIACSITAALHVWKRNNLLSIGGGTICYMLMIQLIFV